MNTIDLCSSGYHCAHTETNSTMHNAQDHPTMPCISIVKYLLHMYYGKGCQSNPSVTKSGSNFKLTQLILELQQCEVHINAKQTEPEEQCTVT